MEKSKESKEFVHVDGRLNEVVTLKDRRGRIIHRLISPLRVEFKASDVLQVIIGSALLAIPVAFTEETWHLGEQLPMLNIVGLFLLSLLFIGSFTYYHYYKKTMEHHYEEFLKRTLLTYVISFIVVGFLLTLIQKTPWTADYLLAIKRTIIVTFPASLSGTLADTIK